MLEDSTSKPGLQKRRNFSSSTEPFHTANNIFLFYGGGDRANIIEGITRRIRKSSQPIVVGGEPGSGKTMMSLVLADRMKRNYNVVRYEHPAVDSASLLRHLLIEISPQAAIALSRNSRDATLALTDSNSELLSGQVETSLAPDQSLESEQSIASDNSAAVLDSMYASICATLAQGTPNNKPILLVIDSGRVPDGQCVELLERLCQITNRFGNVFSVTLFVTTPPPQAHPGARETSKSVESVDETGKRGTPTTAGSILEGSEHFLLRRLSLAEINEYLQHHMLLFDFNRRDLFSREMAYFIADRTDGIFKSINVLACHAFMLANLEGAGQMSMSHLLMAGLPRRVEKKPLWYRRRKSVQRFYLASLMTTLFLIFGAALLMLG